MSDKEKDIMKKIGENFPKLDEMKQNYVLGVVNGMAAMVDIKPNQQKGNG